MNSEAGYGLILWLIVDRTRYLGFGAERGMQYISIGFSKRISGVVQIRDGMRCVIEITTVCRLFLCLFISLFDI